MRRNLSAMSTAASRRRWWRGAIAIGAVAAVGLALAAPAAAASPVETVHAAQAPAPASSPSSASSQAQSGASAVGDNPHADAVLLPPNPASGLRLSNEINCGGRAVTYEAWPTLLATATDNNNPPMPLGLWFEVWDNTTSTIKAKNTVSVDIASGSRGSWPVNVNLGNGDYSFRVRVENHIPPSLGQNLWSEWSPWYSFSTRAVPPSQTPSIASFDYPSYNWGYASDAPGTFTFNANDAPNIIGFTYTFMGSGTEVSPNSLDCDFNKTFGTRGGWVAGSSTATITVPAGLSVGLHRLYVRAIDDGHNLSPESLEYTFFVSPTYAGMPVQRIEAETAPVSQPFDQGVTLEPRPNCCGVTWSGGAQLLFEATAPNLSFDLTFSTPGGADYVLGAGLTKGNEYGQLTFLVDGKPLANTDTNPWDGYNPTLTTGYQSFGMVHLTKGTHTLTVKVVGTNAASVDNRYMAGIDYLFVVPLSNITPASVTGLPPLAEF